MMVSGGILRPSYFLLYVSYYSTKYRLSCISHYAYSVGGQVDHVGKVSDNGQHLREGVP